MKLRLALAGIVLALTFCVAVLCDPPGSRITVDAYQQIQVGMTQQQVEGILGGRARNESACLFETLQFSTKRRLDEWWGPDIVISITFDAQDRVCTKKMETHDYGSEQKPTLWDTVRPWLPW